MTKKKPDFLRDLDTAIMDELTGGGIELKAGKNTTTKKQKEWLEYLRQQGYYTAVCYGWQPAAQLIEQYLLHSDELTKEQETVTMR